MTDTATTDLSKHPLVERRYDDLKAWWHGTASDGNGGAQP